MLRTATIRDVPAARFPPVDAVEHFPNERGPLYGPRAFLFARVSRFANLLRPRSPGRACELASLSRRPPSCHTPTSHAACAPQFRDHRSSSFPSHFHSLWVPVGCYGWCAGLIAPAQLPIWAFAANPVCPPGPWVTSAPRESHH